MGNKPSIFNLMLDKKIQDTPRRGKKSLRGILANYKDAALRKKERFAWPNAAADKHKKK